MDVTAIRGLLFDKDGTLFDFADTWEAWAQAFLLRLSEGDVRLAERAGRAIGFDVATGTFSRESVVIAGTPAEIAEALAPVYPRIPAREMLVVLNEEAARAPQRATVPLAPLLTRLRAAGLKLGVATNDAEGPARAHLAAAEVTGYFDFIAGCDSGFGGKPAPGQMQAFAAATGIPAAKIAMIGDSLHDLRAGRAAGMTCVAVLTGLAEERTLAPHADVVLPDIGHLPGWLGLPD